MEQTLSKFTKLERNIFGFRFALVKAKEIKSKNFDLLHGVWATMPATAVFAISQLTKTPFSMGACVYDVQERRRLGG